MDQHADALEQATERTGPVRVMLVDDQHLLRMGFRLILEGEEDLEVVAEAADGVEALELMRTLPEEQLPQVVLMDVRMPRMDGIEATGRIVSDHPCARVIILTTFDLDEYAFSGLQAGASAFLLKDVAPEDLVGAVRVVAEGDAVVAPRITQRLLETYVRRPAGSDDGSPAASQQGPASPPVASSSAAPQQSGTQQSATQQSGGGQSGGERPTGEQIAAALDDGVVREPLTQRETEVLFAVAEGLSNAEIAGRFFLSEATVKTHVRRILTKLQLRDRVQAVVYAYQTGLVG
ncbi:response regulator transcription factor [Nesterenkonia sp. PF2B19]|uniref:response regulator transcription factor n=1 Tax=unclassified Nesterenkonia TaxID=2629769 RepID=UPI000871F1F8|nr:response regulator transcription factor [Nesterenkonia sp. PF2B19]OSM42216.1 DNA-binding response regulator [Nesterenkonia sp. PF2B19]